MRAGARFLVITAHGKRFECLNRAEVHKLRRRGFEIVAILPVHDAGRPNP